MEAPRLLGDGILKPAPFAPFRYGPLERLGVPALAFFACAAAAVAAPNAIGLIGKKDDFQTAAPNAILIDATTGTVLVEKNADAPTAPSSMAKLMTTEVVFNE